MWSAYHQSLRVTVTPGVHQLHQTKTNIGRVTVGCLSTTLWQQKVILTKATVVGIIRAKCSSAYLCHTLNTVQFFLVQVIGILQVSVRLRELQVDVVKPKWTLAQMFTRQVRPLQEWKVISTEFDQHDPQGGFGRNKQSEEKNWITPVHWAAYHHSLVVEAAVINKTSVPLLTRCNPVYTQANQVRIDVNKTGALGFAERLNNERCQPERKNRRRRRYKYIACSVPQMKLKDRRAWKR